MRTAVRALHRTARRARREALRLGMREALPLLRGILIRAQEIEDSQDCVADAGSAAKAAAASDPQLCIGAIYDNLALLSDLYATGHHETFRVDLMAVRARADELRSIICSFSRSSDGGRPHRRRETQSDRKATRLRLVGNHPAQTATRARVLLVGEEESADRTASLLTRLRYEVTPARTTGDAVDRVDAQSFDVVMLPIGPGRVASLETLQLLREHRVGRRIPVLVVGSIPGAENVQRCLEAGADDYLLEPFDATMLDARISACLERARQRHAQGALLARLEEDKKRSERLLSNMLPDGVAERLERGKSLVADHYDEVTVLMCDIAGFTKIAEGLTPMGLVQMLNRLFSEFDRLARRFGMQKIKTTGDAYMAVCGLPKPSPHHAQCAALMGLAMIEVVKTLPLGVPLEVRIGLHSGPVVAGVIGEERFFYDVWGDTVNTASRMESYSTANRIHVSPVTAKILGGNFELESRGVNWIRSKGDIETFFLNGVRVAGRALDVEDGLEAVSASIGAEPRIEGADTSRIDETVPLQAMGNEETPR